jgi:hydrogenase maturation protease
MTRVSSEVSQLQKKSTTLILGVGNPILSDDGVGIHVMRELQKKYSHIPNLEFDEVSIGGLSLAERFIGYDQVIMIDALALEGGKPGDVYRHTINDYRTTIHTYCAHDCNLATAYDILKEQLGEGKLPAEIVIIGIEVEIINKFSEELSDTEKKAMPKAPNIAEEEIT